MAKKEEKIGDALLKVALGCSVAEVTEEYAEVDGALKLTKRKKIKRDIPPDLKAVQLLLERGEADLSKMSDEQLEAEKERLLAVLKEKSGEAEEDCGAGAESVKAEVKKAVKKRAKPRKRVVRTPKTE